MHDEVFDIAIIGLGPAGANFARLVSPNFRVIAFDKKPADPAAQGFHKPCGGLLNPNSQEAFARLGLQLPKSVLSDPMIFSVKTIDLGQNLKRNYLRNYINTDRHEFDLWLKSLIPSHVQVLHNSIVTAIAFDKQLACFKVTATIDGTARTFMARTVVGADGAVSPTRHAICPGYKPIAYVAKQQWFSAEGIDKSYACFLDSRLTDSYGWLATKHDKVILGIALPQQNCKEAFDIFVQRVKDYGYLLGEPLKTEACLVLKPGNFCHGNGQGAFLLGEAAGFITPNLEGSSSALYSSTALAAAFNRHTTLTPKDCKDILASYKSGTRRIRLRILLKRLKSPFIYHPFLRRLVMKSAIAALPE